jgi:hypothetical protein
MRETSAANGKLSSTTHGMFGTPEYNTWAKTIQRCCNPRDTSYVNYGARGIAVCERWREFENFIADMGARPDGRSGARSLYRLDRIDNAGNYEPANCQWATWRQQNNNKRRADFSYRQQPEYREAMRAAANKRWHHDY